MCIINSLSDLTATIGGIINQNNNCQILYRGQRENWDPIPSAIRQRSMFTSFDFESLVSEFKRICPAVNHFLVASTFRDIFAELYPKYESICSSPTNIFDDVNDFDFVQFLLQCLRQQYSRSTMFLDVSSSICVALKMGRLDFPTSGISEGRFVITPGLVSDGYVYLSVYMIPQERIINFSPNPDQYLQAAREFYRLKNINQSDFYFAVNCSTMNSAQRLINQKSWFLGCLPNDDFSRSLAHYNYGNVFRREVLKIPSLVVEEYLSERSRQGSINLFPSNDSVLNWVNTRTTLRENAIHDNRLDDNDLGICIYDIIDPGNILVCPER